MLNRFVWETYLKSGGNDVVEMFRKNLVEEYCFNAKSWGQYVAVTLNAAFDRSEAHVWQEGNRAKTSGSIGFSMSDECFITLSSHIADGGAITAFYTFPQDFALIQNIRKIMLSR